MHAIGFYSALFATQPAVVKTDYAKWMLDDPRVNFAISTRGRAPGLNHLGIQVEDKAELHEVYARLRQAGGPVIEQGETACCYAKSEKSWIEDPAGIAWETFHTTGEHRLRRRQRRARGPCGQCQGLLRAQRTSRSAARRRPRRPVANNSVSGTRVHKRVARRRYNNEFNVGAHRTGRSK